jgi:hypothetical protein
LLGKFFSEGSGYLWKQYEVITPFPIIEYALQLELWRNHYEWKWTKEYNVAALEDYRIGFLAKV